MGIRLTWQENNAAEQGHRVYRSTAPFDATSLPSPVAELGPDVTEFEDSVPAMGVTYFYRVSAFTPGTERVGDLIEVPTPANPVREALVRFWPTSAKGFPYNFFTYTGGAIPEFVDPVYPLYSVQGQHLPWTLRHTIGSNEGTQLGDPEVEYSTLDWPAEMPFYQGTDVQVRVYAAGRSRMAWELGGLDPSKTYSLEFISARHETSVNVRQCSMTVQDEYKSMSVKNNTGTTLDFPLVTPTLDGRIVFGLGSEGSASEWNYLSAFKIKEN